MPHIYVTENNVKLGYTGGQLVVTYVDGSHPERAVPFSEVNGISVFGRAQLSTQLIRECISQSIPVLYYSDDGHYFGNISSSDRIDPLRQKLQIYLTDDPVFCLAWAKRIVDAKIRNSIALLKSHATDYCFSDAELKPLYHSLANIEAAPSIETVLGYEGNAAKGYFDCLPKLLRNDAFVFKGRSSRPPKDPFNSMLSFGYSLFFRNIIGAIERHGLHPYFAYLHKLQFGHAALASDLVEEWRAPLVDRTVVNVVNAREVEIDDFFQNDAGAIYMTKGASKALTDRFSAIIALNDQYFQSSGNTRSYGFQVALDMKIVNLIDAIEKRDASIYVPFIWKPELV